MGTEQLSSERKPDNEGSAGDSSTEELDYDNETVAAKNRRHEQLRYWRRQSKNNRSLSNHWKSRYQRERSINESDMRSLFFGIASVLIGAVVAFVGTILLVHVESERTHGWQQEQCTISAVTMHNGSNVAKQAISCIYFSVRVEDGRELCAIPAHVAGSGHIYNEPACTDHSVLTTDPDVNYWFDRANQWGFHTAKDVKVDCLVPIHSAHPLSAKRCMTTVASRGTIASMYSSWADRYVYLVRRNLDGIAATEAATRPAFDSALGLLIAGLSVFLFGAFCTCRRNVVSCVRATVDTCAYRDRLLRNHADELVKAS